MEFNYLYKAKVLSVYDGDTITAQVDLGFKTFTIEKIRLYGIDTPELRGEERKDGLVSRDRLRDLIDGKDIILRTIKDKKGKYGRYLGVIYLDGVDVNQQLISEGLAVKY